jgi:hypothetical protein
MATELGLTVEKNIKSCIQELPIRAAVKTKTLKGPNLVNILQSYEYLVTKDMKAFIIGAVLSDGYISPTGVITINQSLHRYSTYSLAIHTIKMLAPIISYIEINFKRSGDEQSGQVPNTKAVIRNSSKETKKSYDFF